MIYIIAITELRHSPLPAFNEKAMNSFWGYSIAPILLKVWTVLILVSFVFSYDSCCKRERVAKYDTKCGCCCPQEPKKQLEVKRVGLPQKCYTASSLWKL